MFSHNAFFWGTVFFLAGVLFASMGWKSLILAIFLLALGAAFLASVLFRNQRLLTLIILLPLFLFGAIYFTFREMNIREERRLSSDATAEFQGRVISNPQRKKFQEFKLELLPPNKGIILVQTHPFPQVKFGNTLTLSGKIAAPPTGDYGKYFRKEAIIGVMRYPKLEIIKADSRSFRGGLFALKRRIVEAFQKTLPYEEAAFLGGITVGQREEFSKEFKEAMAKSGTTHLVALSGYNIVILINTSLGAIGCFLSRKKAIIATFMLVLTFVVMTGAEASIVRAAIMGILIEIAPLTGRIYAPRNSIAATALLMTLYNPAVLAFDIGFQLSFLALIGIIYLAPIFRRLFRVSAEGSLFAWKENIAGTLAAQIMVAPVLISAFGSVSLIALAANLFILGAIPLTMTLGFIIVGGHLVSGGFAQIVAWFAYVLLKFETGAIKFFAAIPIPFSLKLNPVMIFAYYAMLVGVIYAHRALSRRAPETSAAPA